MNPRSPRLMVALIVVALGFLVSATPARAHTELVSTEPAAGAVLAAAPAEVILNFDEDLLAASVESSILDSAGDLVSEPVPSVSGAVVSIPWPSGLPAGDYEVAYRVASGDGHPITGSVRFSITSESSPSGEAEVAPPVGATPFAPSPAESASEPAPAASQDGGMAINPFFVGLLLVIAAIIGAVVVARRGRR